MQMEMQMEALPQLHLSSLLRSTLALPQMQVQLQRPNLLTLTLTVQWNQPLRYLQAPGATQVQMQRPQ